MDIGDFIKCVDNSYSYIVKGETYVVEQIKNHYVVISNLEGVVLPGIYMKSDFEIVKSPACKRSSAHKADDYVAAFNAWQDSYLNDPQAFEDSHTTAIRHLTEKLNGEVPSYGAVCSLLFQEYLSKVKTQESK